MQHHFYFCNFNYIHSSSIKRTICILYTKRKTHIIYLIKFGKKIRIINIQKFQWQRKLKRANDFLKYDINS